MFTTRNSYAGEIAFAVEKDALLASITNATVTVPTYFIDLTYFGFTSQPAITQAR